MSLRSLFLGCTVALAGLAAMSSDAKDYGQWTPLFNGKNLDGWQHIGPGSFAIENGMLKTQGGMGLLWYTKEKLSNCVLRVVFKVPEPMKAGNSGIFIRIPTEPTEPWMPVNKGYEVQIDHSEDDYHRTGTLYSLTKAMAKPALKEWNTMEITLTRRSHRRDRERREGHRLSRRRSGAGEEQVVRAGSRPPRCRRLLRAAEPQRQGHGAVP